VFTGWFWYVGMLAPVIGIVQLGAQAHADRYTYLPQIGLYVALAWGCAKLDLGKFGENLKLASAAAAIAALSVAAFRQTAYWQDSETLWRRALACTSGNAVAHYDLGLTLTAMNRDDDALAEYQQAAECRPRNPYFHYVLANALVKKGRLDEGISEYQSALDLRPDNVNVRNNLATTLLKKRQVSEAINQFEKILEIQPDNAVVQENLGEALVQIKQIDPAILHFQKAIELQPDNFDAWDALGSALLAKGRVEEAITHFQKALSLRPDFLPAQNNLNRIAWLMATYPEASVRNGPKALELAQQLTHATTNANPLFLGTLAAAYAETGGYSNAVATAEAAQRLALVQNNASQAGALQQQLARYRANEPFRISPVATAQKPAPPQ